MNVAFCINDKYVQFTIPAILSLLSNNNETKTNIYILHSDISDKSQSTLVSITKKYNCSIIFKYVDPDLFPKTMRTLAHISHEVYYRLMLSSILYDVDKVLYLDGDIIINKSISPYYNQNISSYYIAAIRGHGAMKSEYPKSIDTEIYVNSGIMLMNLDLIRMNNKERELLDFVYDNNENLKYRSPNQDAINIVFKNKIKVIENKFNTSRAMLKDGSVKLDDAVIIHYTTSRKPWKKSLLSTKIESLFKVMGKANLLWFKYNKY